MLQMTRKVGWDQRGGATVEFALVVLPLLLITLGMIEFSIIGFQWNMAEKSTQLGARRAVVWDPPAPRLRCSLVSSDTDADCRGPFISGQMLGLATLPTFTVMCTAASECTCTGSGCDSFGDPGWDEDAFNQIVGEMQRTMPGIGPEDVAISYRHVGLGFAGRVGGGVVPAVTVEVQGLQYEFLALAPLLGIFGNDLTSITFPPFTATLIGEDLDTDGGAS